MQLVADIAPEVNEPVDTQALHVNFEIRRAPAEVIFRAYGLLTGWERSVPFARIEAAKLTWPKRLLATTAREFGNGI